MERIKILVKVPPKKEELFQTFPFLITLHDEFPGSEIYIICEEDCSALFPFLPFRARVFERPKNKLDLIQTHHFVVNLQEVFNIDIFFDLENSFNSAFMGFNFRAPIRVGFDIGWSRHLLTHKYPDEEKISVENKSMRLLENYTKKKFNETKIFNESVDLQTVEKVEKLFKEPEQVKIVMVMLDNLETTIKEIELWKAFFEKFTNQKFVIWSLDDQDAISDIFSTIDLGRNQLLMHTGCFAKEMTYLFSKVSGVVTNNVFGESLCSYYGVDAISLMEDSLPTSSYTYYRYRPRRIRYKKENPNIFYHEAEDREFESLNAVVDYLHFIFKL
jgi:ADP-heptose:LPS heptosyltransferase